MNIVVRGSITFLVCFLTLLSTVVYADRDDRDRRDRVEKRDGGNRNERPMQDFRIDKRYDHNRPYPRDGYTVRALPERRPPIRYRDRSYFYFGGTWYLPSGPDYVVVRPPVGIIVPILPPYYTTVWLYGTPYYYANDTYYVWRPDLHGYQVSNPPAVEDKPEPTYLADELFIYPKQGQKEQQQADDRYACHRWGVDQTGYDPTQPPSNVAATELSKMREDYHRAMRACLEGRGYSVR